MLSSDNERPSPVRGSRTTDQPSKCCSSLPEAVGSIRGDQHGDGDNEAANVLFAAPTISGNSETEFKMKWGMQRPSLRKQIAARTSLKRYVRQSLSFKAPRGWGWLTNPKRAAYNRIYYRTTFGLGDLFRPRRRASSGCLIVVVAGVVVVGLLVAAVFV